MIEKALSVLLLEDMKTDLELVRRQVSKVAPNAMFVVAESKEAFFKKIEWKVPDIILADYRLPNFTGYEALQYTKKHLPFVPFIFVTGTLNSEEAAAKTILDGASGYLLKRNIKDLGPLLERVLREKEAALEMEKKRLAREKQQEILVLKIVELMRKAPDFKEKEAINKSLEKLLNNLRHRVE
jgi:response regulator RpfG family c-di-GMP phosphodiesterase